jgi:hypothetical protein
MLPRAVLDNSGPRACYERGDARKLPFGDETFDAVCCFGALYLMPEPFRVALEWCGCSGPGPDRDPYQLCPRSGSDPPRTDRRRPRHRAHDVRQTHLCRSVLVGRPGRRRTTDAARVAVRCRRKAGLKRPAAHLAFRRRPCRRRGSEPPRCPLHTPRPTDRRP